MRILFITCISHRYDLIKLSIRGGQKDEKSYSNLAQMFSSVKYRAEQFLFYKLFDSIIFLPKIALLFLQGNKPKNTKGNIGIYLSF